MTTLLLVQRKITSLSASAWAGAAEEYFVWENRRGIFSTFILASLAILIAAYIIALYVSFSLGLAMQENFEKHAILGKQVVEAELLLQGKISGLARAQMPIVESMVRVSEIKYLASENVAISHASFQP